MLKSTTAGTGGRAEEDAHPLRTLRLRPTTEITNKKDFFTITLRGMERTAKSRRQKGAGRCGAIWLLAKFLNYGLSNEKQLWPTSYQFCDCDAPLIRA